MKFSQLFASSLGLAALALSFSATAHAYPAGPNECAVIFAGDNYDGPRAVIEKGASIADLGDYRAHHHDCGEGWDNRVGSVLVMPGCTLTAYQYLNFDINYYTDREMGGQIRIFANDGANGLNRHVSFECNGFDDLMSSLTCNCSQ
jgi:hypothetical protein